LRKPRHFLYEANEKITTPYQYYPSFLYYFTSTRKRGKRNYDELKKGKTRKKKKTPRQSCKGEE